MLKLATNYLAVLLTILCAPMGMAQRRAQAPPVSSRSAIDYSKFSHETSKHKGACNSCHKIPTPNWQKVSGYPDVSDYPDHSACVSCHRLQFFKGARPLICTNCHQKVSPRDEARLAFRDRTGSAQFQIEFPHDKHQDVIAQLQPARPSHSVFASISFRFPQKTPTFNNCEICHGPMAEVPKPPAGGWADNIQPEAATFKSVPTSHGSCFNCHWKSQQPIAENCNGCHKLNTEKTVIIAPTRISLKFKHEGGGEKRNHIAECTTCHINITKSSSLRGLRPDVPITACTECHNKDGLRQDLNKELFAIDRDRTFVCIYCHTSNIGKQDPPASHYLITERPPLKRNDIK